MLEKVPGQSLGFNVVGKHEEGYLGVYVNKINPGGAAHTYVFPHSLFGGDTCIVPGQLRKIAAKIIRHRKAL